MFASLKTIGELKRTTGSSLPVQEIKPKGKGPHVFRLIIFDNDQHMVTHEDIEFTSNTVHEWRYVGNAKANKPMDRLTTTGLNYILGFDKNKEIEKPNKWVLNVAQSIPKVGEYLKRVTSWYSPEEWKDKIGEDWFNAVLYSVAVKEKGERIDLAKLKEYEEYILGMGADEKGEVRCQLCGRPTSMDNPDYPGGTLLKIYITDKKGFTSGIHDSREARFRTHVVCRDCKNLLELGQRFIMDKMQIRVGKLSAYVVPSIAKGNNPKVLDLIKVEGSGWIVSFESLRKTEIEVYDEADFMNWVYAVTLIWGSAQQSKFSVSRVMYDISFPRFLEVKRVSGELERGLSIKDLTGWSLDVNALYAVTPIKESSRGVIATPFLDIMSSILEGYSLDRTYVLSSFLQVMKCVRTGTCQNSLSMKLSLEKASLISTGFIRLLEQLSDMSLTQTSKDSISDPKEYAESLGLTKGKKGLFLLGVVTASVGTAQWKKGDKKKAVLDRIDFEGMDLSDVRVYASRLMESLRDYNILKYNEGLLGEAVSMINEDKESLSSPEENVFWILSGYSWRTLNLMKSGEIKEEEEND
ncbi:TM1802 family CRISPR-associated protein [Metallosphaera hakonensis]|uniref:Type I-B CRISPR-associated protein Cas8b/Csh1 n=1 Tax=Metallosphaera hakonensis JCM 8857 = DSM 7519 TaxID=1293036 RepID=A0A2U9IRL2_9CREN|nr:TM1802 family CRISPR-associated protein [Metallosphaera hakonensis]AWR98645.1 hypothetical protein DFR87_01815 [Metallosphaera hakonensis JCM 8857 = DSM 7519]